MKKAYLLAMILFVGLATMKASSPVVKSNSKTQVKRIAQGVRSGSLTRMEAKQLKNQQIHINNVKKVAKADGVVTIKERAIIQHKQCKANRAIYRKKHN